MSLIVCRCPLIRSYDFSLNYTFIVRSQVHFTWTELFDSAVAAVNVNRKEVFKPGDLWVGVAARGTKHGGGPRSFHHLQLRAHVYDWKPVRDLVLWKTHA